LLSFHTVLGSITDVHLIFLNGKQQRVVHGCLGLLIVGEQGQRSAAVKWLASDVGEPHHLPKQRLNNYRPLSYTAMK